MMMRTSSCRRKPAFHRIHIPSASLPYEGYYTRKNQACEPPIPTKTGVFHRKTPPTYHVSSLIFTSEIFEISALSLFICQLLNMIFSLLNADAITLDKTSPRTSIVPMVIRKCGTVSSPVNISPSATALL